MNTLKRANDCAQPVANKKQKTDCVKIYCKYNITISLRSENIKQFPQLKKHIVNNRIHLVDFMGSDVFKILHNNDNIYELCNIPLLNYLEFDDLTKIKFGDKQMVLGEYNKYADKLSCVKHVDKFIDEYGNIITDNINFNEKWNYEQDINKWGDMLKEYINLYDELPVNIWNRLVYLFYIQNNTVILSKILRIIISNDKYSKLDISNKGDFYKFIISESKLNLILCDVIRDFNNRYNLGNVFKDSSFTELCIISNYILYKFRDVGDNIFNKTSDFTFKFILFKEYKIDIDYVKLKNIVEKRISELNSNSITGY